MPEQQPNVKIILWQPAKVPLFMCHPQRERIASAARNRYTVPVWQSSRKI